jgi:hypothetical protein
MTVRTLLHNYFPSSSISLLPCAHALSYTKSSHTITDVGTLRGLSRQMSAPLFYWVVCKTNIAVNINVIQGKPMQQGGKRKHLNFHLDSSFSPSSPFTCAVTSWASSLLHPYSRPIALRSILLKNPEIARKLWELGFSRRRLCTDI